MWQKAFQKKRKKEYNIVFTPVAAPVKGGYYGFSAGCSF
nr:MAG TPA: hypothetical protein [Caudoviricetes sp.]